MDYNGGSGSYGGGRGPYQGGGDSFQNQRRGPFGINKIILVGSVVYGPEDKYNGEIVQLGLSTGNINTTKRPDGGTEEYRETYDIVLYKGAARYVMSSQVTKGTWLYVEGRLRKRMWYDAKSGMKRTSYDVVAQRIIILNNMVHAWERQAQMRQTTGGGQRFEGRSYAPPSQVSEMEPPDFSPDAGGFPPPMDDMPSGVDPSIPFDPNIPGGEEDPFQP